MTGLVLVLVTVLAVPAPAGAVSRDVASDGLELDEALRLAAAAPAVAAIEAEEEVARAEEWQARLLPNPELSYQGYARALGSSDAINGQQHQVDLGGPLLLAGQRRARMRAARSRTAAVRGSTCVARVSLQREAALAWVDLLAAQQRVETLAEGREALAAAAELTRARATHGAQTEYDAQRVGAELRTFDSELRTAEVDRIDASRRLANLVGKPRWTPRAAGSLEGAAREVDVSRGDPDLRTIPAVTLAQRVESASRANVAVAKRERWPVPSIYGGVYGTTDGDSVSMTFGLSLPLPIFDRGQAGVARARAEVRRARLQTTAVQRLAAGEVARARAVLGERRRAVNEWDTHVREAVPRLREMARKAYAGGVSSVLELIDAERTHLRAHLRAVELSRAHAASAIELHAARGTLAASCD